MMIQCCTCCVTDGKRSYFKPNPDDLIGGNFMHSWIPPHLYSMRCMLATLGNTAESKYSQSYSHFRWWTLQLHISRMLKVLEKVSRISRTILCHFNNHVFFLLVCLLTLFYCRPILCSLCFLLMYFHFSVYTVNHAGIHIIPPCCLNTNYYYTIKLT